MPRATSNVERTSQRTQRQTAPRIRRTPHCSLSRPATDVLTLAPASALSLPSLAGVPQGFTHRTDSTVLLPVADYLIAQGHGTRREWNAAKHDLPKFIEQSISRLIRSTGYEQNKKYGPTLTASLSDNEGYYSVGYKLEDASLRLAIDAGEAGWFRMGPITRKLERTAKGLGAAFYTAVIDTLWEVGWTFTYDEAEQQRDFQLEGIENEEGKTYAEMSPAERAQYEVIDPEIAIPKHLKEVARGGFTEKRRDLLARHKSGRHAKLISLALELGELATKLHKYPREHPEGDILPSYVVYIEDHDPITAAFDEWATHALEGDVTHHWQRTFKTTPEAIAKTFEAFALAVRILATASKLSTLVNGAK
jgi:hypothetical protein